jgi:cyclase
MYKRLIPVLLIENGRTVKSTKFKDNRYLGDPVNIVKIFNHKEVDEILVLDISASKNVQGPNLEIAQSIAEECFIPCAYGGGIRDTEDASRIFSLGYDKIVLQSSFFKNPDVLFQISKLRGLQAASLSLDVLAGPNRTFVLYDYISKAIRNADLTEVIQSAIELGCGEIIVNSVDRDGCMRGLDLDLVDFVSQICKVPFTIVGGLGNLDHAIQAIDHGASAVAGGSFFSYKSETKGVLISYPSQPLTKTSGLK